MIAKVRLRPISDGRAGRLARGEGDISDMRRGIWRDAPFGKGEIFEYAVFIACFYLVKGAKRNAVIGAEIHVKLRGRINIEF